MWPSKCRTRSSGRTSTGRIKDPRGRLLAARPAAVGTGTSPHAGAHRACQAARLEFDRALRGGQGAGDRVEGFFERGLRAGDLVRGAALERLEMREPRLELFESVLRGAPRRTAPGFLGHGSPHVTAWISANVNCTPLAPLRHWHVYLKGPPGASILTSGTRWSQARKAVQAWSAKAAAVRTRQAVANTRWMPRSGRWSPEPRTSATSHPPRKPPACPQLSTSIPGSSPATKRMRAQVPYCLRTVAPKRPPRRLP